MAVLLVELVFCVSHIADGTPKRTLHCRYSRAVHESRGNAEACGERSLAAGIMTNYLP